MKIRLKARRIPGTDPVTFKNPGGDPIYLKDIGSVSQEITDQVAVALVSKYPDILEYATGDYEPKMAKSYENKVAEPKAIKMKAKAVDPLDPPSGEPDPAA